MDWMIQGSNPTRSKRCFSSPECPDWFWTHPPSYSMDRGSSFPIGAAAVPSGDHSAHLHLASRLRMTEALNVFMHPICLHGIYRMSWFGGY